MTEIPKMLQRLASDLDGKITEVGALPDGSGFATMTMPLPKDHWLTAETGFNVPPMPFKIGTADAPVLNRTRQMWADDVRAAARYAVRCATMNGKDDDFDPDALVQNMVVGMLGYWTPDALSSDAWANPAAPSPGSGEGAP